LNLHKIRVTKGDLSVFAKFSRGIKSKKPGYSQFSTGYFKRKNTANRLAFAINSLSNHFLAEQKNSSRTDRIKNRKTQNELISKVLAGPNKTIPNDQKSKRQPSKKMLIN
ncbi:MAG: hypothetical protein AABY04_04055, partial [Candidatus Micrarchaeota archaeon]